MKNTPFSRAPVLLSASLLLTGAIAVAQPAPAQTPAAPAIALPTREFRVRNMPVSFMAWWLDEGQPMPNQIQSSIASSGEAPQKFTTYYNPFLRRVSPADAANADEPPATAPQRNRPGNALGPENLKLPAGISIVSVQEPLNTLTARGPQASLDALGRLIAEIDVPIEQAEVEMHLVEMTREESKKLGLKFSNDVNSKGDGYTYPAVMLAPGSASTSAINQLVAAGRAKIINAPRITVMSGLTGRLQSTESRAAMLDFDYKESPKELTPGLVFISSTTGLTCGVEIVDEVIKLEAKIEFNNATSEIAGTIRDGQTLAIRLSEFDPNSKTVRIGFLTPRIIKRVSDDIAGPGK